MPFYVYFSGSLASEIKKKEAQENLDVFSFKNNHWLFFLSWIFEIGKFWTYSTNWFHLKKYGSVTSPKKNY